MSDDQIRLHFQALRQQIAILQQEGAKTWAEIDAVLEDLHVIYEQMQTSLEAAMVVEEDLLQQNQQLLERYQHYYDLFQSSPIAHLVIDVDGVILEANHAMATLLNVPQRYLTGKPLGLYVAESNRLAFRTQLNQLSRSSGTQIWQLNFCPRKGEPFIAQLNVAIVHNAEGLIENLRVVVFNLSQSQQIGSQEVRELTSQGIEKMQSPHSVITPLPRSLDGLRVLIVDDETDVREFVTAVLESHGIGVRAVASAAAALEELERFHPDVLVSDIRMPNGDGYSLIQQVRALEARQGGHIPAAAITAYLDEDREKALSAGFEAHLHKLAQPTELIKMVVQLAGRTAQ